GGFVDCPRLQLRVQRRRGSVAGAINGRGPLRPPGTLGLWTGPRPPRPRPTPRSASGGGHPAATIRSARPDVENGAPRPTPRAYVHSQSFVTTLSSRSVSCS